MSIKSGNYLGSFNFNQKLFDLHLNDNKAKTTKRAKKAFEDGEYLLGKKYIAHLLRIDEFEKQLKSNGKLNLYFKNPIEDFLDNSPIGFDDFVDIVYFDKKNKFKI